MASCHKAVGSAMWFEINISPVDFRREQTEMAWTCNVQRKDSEHIGRPGTLLFYGHSHFGFKIFDKNRALWKCQRVPRPYQQEHKAKS